jgi:hypothetical protein
MEQLGFQWMDFQEIWYLVYNIMVRTVTTKRKTPEK